MTRFDPRAFVPSVLLASPFRLFAGYIWLFSAGVAVTFIYVYFNVQVLLVRDVDAVIQSDLASLQQRYDRGGAAALIAAVEERSWSEKALYLITDSTGRQLAGNLQLVSTELWNTQGRAHFAYRTESEATGGTLQRLAYGTVARLPSDLRLIVGRDVEDQEGIKRVMRIAFLLGYGVIMAIGLTGGIRVSRRLLARVDAASKTAHAIMQGNLAKRIPLTPAEDELNSLNRNLNAMLDRIQDLMAGLKDVSDNIAHDLKTPLHRLRTRAERALQSNRSPEKLAEALSAVIEEADELIKTFDALLNIARLESGARAPHFGQLNICALVRDVFDLYQPAAEERGLAITLKCSGDVVIAGEKHLIGQALANLLDNAIKYAANEIEIHLEDKGDAVDIVVADRGGGIAVADRDRVFQRFVRLQPSRSMPGSGLGLSLVAAVARLHGGAVSLEDNDPGLKVRLTLNKNLSDSQATSADDQALHHAA